MQALPPSQEPLHEVQSLQRLDPSRLENGNSPTKSSAKADDAGLRGFVVRTIALLAVLLTIRSFGPSVVEEFRYAWMRGSQRAEYDTATDALPVVSLQHLSRASQLVSQRVAPSVVHIETQVKVSEKTSDELDHLFGYPPEERGERNQGSGVIVTHEGHIVTNLHVVRGYQDIVVQLSDGRRRPATVLGVDRLTDLAVLKVEADGLIAAEWGDSDELEEGALVWAVGSPFGFRHSITSGIVSAKNRSGQVGTAYQDFLQTDAAVNPGNSGGPLVDIQGRVVGINTMIVGPAFQGISLAIPSKVARRIYSRLRRDGAVERGFLGISLEQLTPELSQQLGLPVTAGALVTRLVRLSNQLSPAEEAGLRRGDIIVALDGQQVSTTSQLTRAIAEKTVGDQITLVVVRNGERLVHNVAIGRRPAQLN